MGLIIWCLVWTFVLFLWFWAYGFDLLVFGCILMVYLLAGLRAVGFYCFVRRLLWVFCWIGLLWFVCGCLVVFCLCFDCWVCLWLVCFDAWLTYVLFDCCVPLLVFVGW